MTSETGRGRKAHGPTAIPRAGWRDILLRTKDEQSSDHISLIAAGIAFYGLLAIFPGIAALISIAGLIIDPQTVQQQLDAASGVLPEDAAGIIRDQATQVTSGAGTAISLAAIGGILLALYSASRGMTSLMEGMNIAYDEDEKRGFIMRNLVALLLTLFVILGMIVAFGALVALPIVIGYLPLGSTLEPLLNWGRWPILAIMAVFGLAVLYRFAPSRERPQWTWVSAGAVIATILWLLASVLFSLYVRNFGSYNETYGSLGAVIVLLLWLWLSAYVVLLGAELNSEMEHQTDLDTTTGEPRQMGRRGAVKADTRGETP